MKSSGPKPFQVLLVYGDCELRQKMQREGEVGKGEGEGEEEEEECQSC